MEVERSMMVGPLPGVFFVQMIVVISRKQVLLGKEGVVCHNYCYIKIKY